MELEAAIRAVRNGDHAAFADIIEHSQRRLRACLALQVPDRDLVDEVAHQAYITAFQKLHEYKTGTNFLAWLKRIALLHLRNECRRRQHSSDSSDALMKIVAPGVGPKEAEDIRDDVTQLLRCLEKLGPDARRLLELRYTDALEPSVIAAEMGKAASHVRTMLTRLRQSLLQCMEARHV
jgi:RNA polymerase sigma-70 factor, ECF subfamily